MYILLYFIPFVGEAPGKKQNGKKLLLLLLHPAVPRRKQAQGAPGAENLPPLVAAGNAAPLAVAQCCDVRTVLPTEAVMTVMEKKKGW